MMKIDKPRRRLAAMALGLLCLNSLAIATTLSEVKSRGRIVIGIQSDNPPWGTVDANTGEAGGLDGELGRLFAKELGVKAEFVGLEVANRIPALTSGRVDVLFATMGMVPDRARLVQYSKPYVANAILLVAPKAAAIKTVADLSKLTVGVARSALQDAIVTQHAPPDTNILRLDSDAAAVKALLSGLVQAVAGNIFYTRRLDEARPGVFENKFEFTKLYNGACSRLGEKDMNAALNAFIDKLKASGELTRLQKKWMGSTNTQFPAAVEGVPFVAK